MKIGKVFLALILPVTLIHFSVQPSFSKAKPLVSAKVETPPELDGDGGDDAWEGAKEVVVEAEDGPEISVRTVYTKERVYFLVSWEDFTKSVDMDEWIFDGDKWGIKQETRWEDEPPWDADTDRLAFQWPIRDAEFVEVFGDKGCKKICHSPEKEDKMYTDNSNQVTDIWQWKAALTDPLDYADDGYLDHSNLLKKDEPDDYKRINVAHKWDDTGSGGLNFARNKASDGPKWMPKSGANKVFLVKGEETPLDASKIKKGDTLPGYLLARPRGSRGDIDAAAKYNEVDALWTVELSRKLFTNDKEHDIQFDDLSKPYYFGLAVWENEDLYNHTRVRKPFVLTFKSSTSK